MSSRGFGARAAFGVRGLRLYQDDIPATMPDGQGQTGSFSLLSAQSIEVLRGPFSALYGNASGGVISIFTEEGVEPSTWTATAGAGSYGSQTAGLKVNGASGSFGHVLALSRFQTDGYRRHSAAVRELANVKLSFSPWSDTRLTLSGSHQNQPESEDPLGLTRSQWERDPRQVDPAALQFATRKTIRQSQGGASLERRLSSQLSLKLLAYGGVRAVRQYLGFSGAAASSSGGVTDLERNYEGAGTRLTWSAPVARGSLSVNAGLDFDQQRERRRGFVNLNGALGGLRRDEDDRVANTDGYAQAEWNIASMVSLMAGARVSSVAFRSDDHYVTTLSPDTSGRRDFHHTSPVAGALWHLSEQLHLYASYGEGFETPTFAEFAYRPGGPGLNLALNAARSRASEVGLKALIASRHRVNVALFATNTEDEIVVSSASGG
ncbi:MAG TPA: TonB-dependent receptor, partial [Usitatibacter sp.]|nr:TonB-dependent receptor [Usitatibacter sp.]